MEQLFGKVEDRVGTNEEGSHQKPSKQKTCRQQHGNVTMRYAIRNVLQINSFREELQERSHSFRMSTGGTGWKGLENWRIKMMSLGSL